jgi:3',5'-cyclic AMP phosphodiesterase CpdA
MMSNRKPFCSILHLSDTHLGSSFQDSGGKSREFLRAVQHDKQYVMQAHDSNLLLLLPLELSRIARMNQITFAKAWPGQPAPNFFDRVVVSGDISTDATNEERFQFAHSFITAEMSSLGGVYANQSKVGLRISNQLLIALPGNHDKMRETSLARFNHSFGTSPAPTNYVTVLRRNGSTVFFFVMDSNAYNEGNIARGEIDQSRLSWLLNKLHELSRGIVLDGETFTADECSHSVKCLVLHHHVYPLSWKKKYFNLQGSFTELLGADNLLKAVSGRIHVILHGHEHYPIHFIEPTSKALIISAGTTSQWQPKKLKNSFYHLTFFTDHSIQIDEYVWNGTGFVSRQELQGRRGAVTHQLPSLGMPPN